ncbi:MAG: PRD domain-containing protein [Streptococcaceae bacterium]|jgi:beta-glucoside operon transcriptional antiterminator|nr:PRD domain-containing protein [Streptococcaceae bacterium]MCH4177504.1 PRD domain-containing protein [Streptococcaceae bacterium]
MELIKKINNNFAIAKDSKGQEVIVSGKGIGFQKMPMLLPKDVIVSKVYYGISSKYISFLSEISEDIINVSEKILEFAKRRIDTDLNPNYLFTLADHTDFCIKRIQQGLELDFSLTYDFKLLYMNELEVGHFAIKIIKEDLGIILPEKEAYGFAINLINSEIKISKNSEKDEINHLIVLTVKMIEEELNFKIDKNTDNYERFELHLRYLFSTIWKGSTDTSENELIFRQVSNKYTKEYRTVKKIKDMLYKKKKWNVSNDELLYLIMHINRLYFRQQFYENRDKQI